MSASPKPAGWSERQKKAQARSVETALAAANRRYVDAVAKMARPA